MILDGKEICIVKLEATFVILYLKFTPRKYMLRLLAASYVNLYYSFNILYFQCLINLYEFANIYGQIILNALHISG